MTEMQDTKLAPTEEQVEIIKGVLRPESMMIQAFAGTGKTTTLSMAAKGVRQPALALAFNRSIVQDFQGKFPSNFTVKTINGLGHGAWARALPGVKIDLKDKKIGSLVSEVSRAFKADLDQDQWADCRAMVTGAMQVGLTPGDQGAPLTLDTEEVWKNLADDQLVGEEDFPLLRDVAKEVLSRSIELAKSGIICFDDQVYCPVVLGGKWPQFPVMFVDESQDLSMMNHKMLELAMRQDGKLVVVGDPRQAIYGFRGSHSESMEMISRLKPKWQNLPLATTFRCPKVVVARQQQHAPGYRAWEGNPEGVFDKLDYDEWEVSQGLSGWTGQTLIEMQQGLRHESKGVAILCRNNAPLFKIAFRLLRGGTGVKMLGRDIGKGLEKFSRKICQDDSMRQIECVRAIQDYKERECSLALANGKEEKVASITDKTECLLAVLSGAECRDAGQMRAMLERLFAREQGQITLGSIHRAKGLEWDVVAHLDPWRIPSKWAKEAAQAGDFRQMKQENNLRYVCETRTRHTLVEVKTDDFWSKKS